ncbi:hypothetical protein IIC65_00060 [Candidatus Sumerlaeota bacterium]|nr:hypothetical protein [Candidatus Sumerlaeota bacterium]
MKFSKLPSLGALLTAICFAGVGCANGKLPKGFAWTTLYKDDFSHGMARWKPTDPGAWTLQDIGGGATALTLTTKLSDYDPPYRSPHNIALLQGYETGDFEFTVRARSTEPDYDHRDVCLFFNYQDPANFYYVHFGKATDDHANQIFIVNDAPRTKISTQTTDGTPWDDEWHTLRVVRDVSTGWIDVYFDDMETPWMRARDKTFQGGLFGVGSFDDRVQFDSVELRGIVKE